MYISKFSYSPRYSITPPICSVPSPIPCPYPSHLSLQDAMKQFAHAFLSRYSSSMIMKSIEHRSHT